MQTDDDRYLAMAELMHYTGLSRTTLERLMRDPVDPLPAHRVVGRVRVLRSEYDAWLRARENGSQAPRRRSGKGLSPAKRAGLEALGYVIED